jgi:hypothetical protein
MVIEIGEISAWRAESGDGLFVVDEPLEPGVDVMSSFGRRGTFSLYSDV